MASAADDAADTQARPRMMYDIIREQCDLAVTYAEDGAYQTAARVLARAARITREHARRVQSF